MWGQKWTRRLLPRSSVDRCFDDTNQAERGRERVYRARRRPQCASESVKSGSQRALKKGRQRDSADAFLIPRPSSKADAADPHQLVTQSFICDVASNPTCASDVNAQCRC